ncbi:methyltransferase domain-domain-containing protein [Microdochium bolleyi]|uniref:Methyltransferase domain-domain-containing protein n=1 Tax=Microdochium bolleyi TaxID=196109 RepID=A0A136IUJ5_9PEZI|nr:methyltransferase domain-domain-containing protein [Microdochium bolleyi]
MVSTTRTLQLLFAGAVTILLLSSITSGGSGDHKSAVHKVFNGQIHISKLWPWASKNGKSHGGGRTWVREHVERSERIYQTMVAQREQLDKDYKKARVRKDLFPCTSHQAYQVTPFTIWDYTTAAFNCPHSVQRIGRLGDGGKWICGLELLEELPAPKTPESPSPCVVYSFGINTESSFEDALLSRTKGCEIWGYDFSVNDFGPQLNRSADYVSRAHFNKAGIAGVTDTKKKPPFYSIQDLLKKNGHDHIDVLKMDIEGFEFDTMRSIIDAFRMPGKGKPKPAKNGAKGARDGGAAEESEAAEPGILDALEDDGLGEVPIAQLMIEIHLDPGRIKDTPEFMSWWQTLEDAGFRATWTEPNLLVSTLPLYDGYPRYAEYTFINVKDSKSLILK